MKVHHVQLRQLVPSQTRVLAVRLALLLGQELRGQREPHLVQSRGPGGGLRQDRHHLLGEEESPSLSVIIYFTPENLPQSSRLESGGYDHCLSVLGSHPLRELVSLLATRPPGEPPPPPVRVLQLEETETAGDCSD